MFMYGWFTHSMPRELVCGMAGSSITTSGTNENNLDIPVDCR